MNAVVVVILTLAGMVVGAAVAWLAARGQSSAVAQRKAELEQEVGAVRSQLAQAQQESADVRVAKAVAEQALIDERTKAAEKLEELKAARAEMEARFKVLASAALESNNTSFLQLAKSELEKHQSEAKGELEKRERAVETLVKPIAESLKSVDEHVRELEKSRASAYGGLERLMESMQASQVALTAETGNLVKALRDPQARGRWGELQLRRCLELAGMLKHCDFLEQVSVTDEERKLRPDVVVTLPGEKNLIIDSKVPLEGYSETWNAPDEATRLAGLKNHARQVKQHIDMLSSKSYWSHLQPTPEFVVLFLPGEVFFRAALDADPDLIEYGVDRKVIMTSPTTLIALMRAVAYGWNQKNLAENARKISEAGKQLYERLCTLTGHVESLGGKLDGAVKSYNDMLSSMEKRVFPSGRRMAELAGSLAAEDLPELEQIDCAPKQLDSADWQLQSDAEPLALQGDADKPAGH